MGRASRLKLAGFPGRLRYDRGDGAAKGHRHGHRERQLTGTFGTETVRVPRARIEDETGKVTEWCSKALPRYQRLTRKAEALIAAVYLAGTDTWRVKRALFGRFQGAVSKRVPLLRLWFKQLPASAPSPIGLGPMPPDGQLRAPLATSNASRAWRKVKVDRDAWCARSMADEDIVRLAIGLEPIALHWRTLACAPCRTASTSSGRSGGRCR